MPTIRRHFLTAFKFLWILGILGATARYLFSNRATVLSQIGSISLQQYLLFGIFLGLAKVLLADSMRRSLREVGESVSWRNAYYIYTVSDLSKYIPGGIWGIVGRMSAFSMSGIDLKRGARSLGIEHAWLILSSVFIGVMLVPFFQIQALSTGGLFVVVSVLSFFVWMLCLILVNVFFKIGRFHAKLGAYIVSSQTAIALFFGLSVGVLMRGPGDMTVPLACVGAFALARAAGYVSFFAPAGIGVREFVFVTLLASHYPAAQLLVISGLYRLLTLVFELGVACVLIGARSLR